MKTLLLFLITCAPFTARTQSFLGRERGEVIKSLRESRQLFECRVTENGVQFISCCANTSCRSWYFTPLQTCTTYVITLTDPRTLSEITHNLDISHQKEGECWISQTEVIHATQYTFEGAPIWEISYDLKPSW